MNLLPNTRVYLAAWATDPRNSFDSLAGVVRGSLQMDLLSGHLFVFSNLRRNRLKILFWDKSGWWVYAKLLEAGTMSWPSSHQASIELFTQELTMLLCGMDLSKTHCPPWLQRNTEKRSGHPDECTGKRVETGSHFTANNNDEYPIKTGISGNLIATCWL